MVPAAAPIGEDFQIARISGKDEVYSHLAALGSIEGADVGVMSGLSGNAIVHVKDARITSDKSLSNRIHVKQGGDEHGIKGNKT